ncbi:MAG: hypothetical protein ACE5PV_23615, partial [Candidatus Poribacteria bacterium]
RKRKFLRDSIAAGIVLIAPPLFEYETESLLQGRLHSGVMNISETDTARPGFPQSGRKFLRIPI